MMLSILKSRVLSFGLTVTLLIALLSCEGPAAKLDVFGEKWTPIRDSIFAYRDTIHSISKQGYRQLKEMQADTVYHKHFEPSVVQKLTALYQQELKDYDSLNVKLSNYNSFVRKVENVDSKLEEAKGFVKGNLGADFENLKDPIEIMEDLFPFLDTAQATLQDMKLDKTLYLEKIRGTYRMHADYLASEIRKKNEAAATNSRPQKTLVEHSKK